MAEEQNEGLDPITSLTIELGEIKELLKTVPSMEAIEQKVNGMIGPVLDSNRKLFAQASTAESAVQEEPAGPDAVDVLVTAVLTGMGVDVSEKE